MSSIYVQRPEMQSALDALTKAVGRLLREEFHKITQNAYQDGQQVGRLIKGIEDRLDALSTGLDSGLLAARLYQDDTLEAAFGLVANKLQDITTNAARRPTVLWIRHGDGTRSKVTCGALVDGEQVFNVEHDSGETCEISTGLTAVPVRVVG